MNSERFFHYTEDGKNFVFDFARTDTRKIKIYILGQPSWGGHSAAPHQTHRWHDGRGWLIDIPPERAPVDFQVAELWARYWAGEAIKYIKTGKSFS